MITVGSWMIGCCLIGQFGRESDPARMRNAAAGAQTHGPTGCPSRRAAG